MTEKYIDWHTHTKYSDGADDPATVVRNSKLLGIQNLAITDHDTLIGYGEAIDEAKKWKIDLTPGVEISTEIYHILGLGINPESTRFNSFLKKVRGLQEKICQQRIERLNEVGVPITLKKMKEQFPHPEQRLGKYNVFMTLMIDGDCLEVMEERGYEMAPEDFRRLFGNDGLVGKIPTIHYVTSREAIEEIHRAGGKAIVAHPFKQARSVKDLDVLLKEGLDGVEIQPNYEWRNVDFEKYAQEKGLLVTYGSDYHGSSFNRPLLKRAEKGYNNKIDIDDFFNNRRSQVMK